MDKELAFFVYNSLYSFILCVSLIPASGKTPHYEVFLEVEGDKPSSKDLTKVRFIHRFYILTLIIQNT